MKQRYVLHSRVHMPETYMLCPIPFCPRVFSVDSIQIVPCPFAISTPVAYVLGQGRTLIELMFQLERIGWFCCGYLSSRRWFSLYLCSLEVFSTLLSVS